MIDKKYRYDNIPISDTTRKGMTLNIDDLGAIGRMLSLQDNVYDERFEEILKLLTNQGKAIENLTLTVGRLSDEVKEITRVVYCTKDDVKALKKDVDMLKKINSPLFYTIRLIVGVIAAITIIYMLKGIIF